MGYGVQPELMTKGPNHRKVLVYFQDVKNEIELRANCWDATLSVPGACSRYFPPAAEGEPARLVIVAIEPADFNDVARLAYWGHELAHGRGWVHRDALP